MTKQAGFKRRVRARMGKTGESARPCSGSPSTRARPRTTPRSTGCPRRCTSATATPPTCRGPGSHGGWSTGATSCMRGRCPRLVADRAAPGRLPRSAIRAPCRAEAMRRFTEQDQALEASRDEEYVLWFEADLYDQLQIAEILARLADLGVPAERITLILHRRTRGHRPLRRPRGADRRAVARAAAHERVRSADPVGARAGHPRVGGVPRAHPRGPGCHRRCAAGRAAVPWARRSTGSAGSNPATRDSPVADRAAGAGRRRRRSATPPGAPSGRPGLPGDAAIHGRHLVPSPDGPDGAGAAPTAPPRPARPPRGTGDGRVPDRHRYWPARPTRSPSTASTGGSAACACRATTCRGAGTMAPKPSSTSPPRHRSPKLAMPPMSTGLRAVHSTPRRAVHLLADPAPLGLQAGEG